MIFVDTSAFFALVASDDRNHGRALRTVDRVAKEPKCTHSYVLSETISLLDARLGRPSVRIFKERVPPLLDTVVWIDSDMHQAALEVLTSTRSKRVSFVDLVSFEVMRRRGIEVAFAYDTDFTKAGFTLLR